MSEWLGIDGALERYNLRDRAGEVTAAIESGDLYAVKSNPEIVRLHGEWIISTEDIERWLRGEPSPWPPASTHNAKPDEDDEINAHEAARIAGINRRQISYHDAELQPRSVHRGSRAHKMYSRAVVEAWARSRNADFEECSR